MSQLAHKPEIIRIMRKDLRKDSLLLGFLNNWARDLPFMTP
jgi:hypothetical protein